MSRRAWLCVMIALSAGAIKTMPVEHAKCFKKSKTNTNGANDDFILKLPTAVTNGMMIRLEGMMSLKEPFIAIMKGAENICEIQYVMDTTKLRVYYAKGDDLCYREIDYFIDQPFINIETNFTLNLIANANDMNDKINLDFTFDTGMNGDRLVSCPIEDLNDIGYIHIKQGVQLLSKMVVIFS